MERDQRLAKSGISVKDRDLAERDSAGPQPAHALRLHTSQRDQHRTFFCVGLWPARAAISCEIAVDLQLAARLRPFIIVAKRGDSVDRNLSNQPAVGVTHRARSIGNNAQDVTNPPHRDAPP